MQEFRKVIITLIFAAFSLILLILMGVFLINRFSGNNSQTNEINSQIIIDKITDQYFIVTKTIFIDEETEIIVDEGSGWSNFWWGSTINAEGLIRVDLGVDMNKLTKEDISLDHQNKKITIILPETEILDSSLEGEIEVNSSKGVFRRFFGSDQNEDYNQALSALTEEAENAVRKDEELFTEAREDSKKFIEILLDEFGYEVEIKDTE
jgi:hypothetical protein